MTTPTSRRLHPQIVDRPVARRRWAAWTPRYIWGIVLDAAKQRQAAPMLLTSYITYVRWYQGRFPKQTDFEPFHNWMILLANYDLGMAAAWRDRSPKRIRQYERAIMVGPRRTK